MTISEFKENLKLVFDDDLRTRPLKWNNYVDLTIIGVIIISTIEVFLSTFDSVVERYGTILNFINWFTILFFTVEIALRIWTADLLDDKYKGFMGRLHYCCSFYGLVDIVSTLPFYLSFFLSTPYSVLKVFRVFRLLRLFHYMKSPRLLVKAVSSKKDELLASVAFLALVTVILSFLLYFAEHAVQPEQCENGWQSLMWAFAKYLGDPGKIADFTLVSPWANFIAFLVGILGVAIFAVPTGLIGSGFMDAIEEDKKAREMEEASVILHKRFRRTGQTSSWYFNEEKKKRTYKYVDRYQSMVYLQINSGMSSEKIMDVVNYCPDFRLVNMASTQSGIAQNMRHDRLVVVNFPLNTEYGCCLDRESNVTIVAPAALSQMATGNAAFSLAAMGGFNYVSRELTPNPEDPFGFYTMDKEDLDLMGDYDKKEDVESQALHFMDDLKKLKQRSEARGEKHWFIFVLRTTKSELVHFWRLATDEKKEMANRITVEADNNREYGSTILLEDEEKFQTIFQEVQSALSERKVTVRDEEKNIVTKIDNCDRLKGVKPSNIMCRMGGGIDCNALTIRFGYGVILVNNTHLLAMKDIADAFKRHIEPDREIPEEAKRCYLEDGDGFADKYGEEKVFLRSPQALKEMIRKANEYARARFEHLDLDGKEQKDFAEHCKSRKRNTIVNGK